MGATPGSGTDADVYVMLQGSLGDTGRRKLEKEMKISLKERYTYNFCKIFSTFGTQSISCRFSGNREVYKAQFAMLCDSKCVCLSISLPYVGNTNPYVADTSNTDR